MNRVNHSLTARSLSAPRCRTTTSRPSRFWYYETVSSTSASTSANQQNPATSTSESSTNHQLPGGGGGDGSCEKGLLRPGGGACFGCGAEVSMEWRVLPGVSGGYHCSKCRWHCESLKELVFRSGGWGKQRLTSYIVACCSKSAEKQLANKTHRLRLKFPPRHGKKILTCELHNGQIQKWVILNACTAPPLPNRTRRTSLTRIMARRSSKPYDQS